MTTSDAVRDALRAQTLSPDAFRAALVAVAPDRRDAWLDAVLDLATIPPDGADLPRGCTPYLPCSADALLRVVHAAAIGPGDVVVDVGAGVGRAALLVRALTGATVVGVEIQAALADAARACIAATGLDRVSIVHGDATTGLPEGSVYLLYCPFGGARLDAFLDTLAERPRPYRIATVDVPTLVRPWLAPLGPTEGEVAVYTAHSRGGAAGVPASFRR